MSPGTRMKRKLFLLSLVLVASACSPALAAGLSPTSTPSVLENIPRLIGRLHPVVVHFPIALLAVAVLFEVIAIVVKKERIRPSTSGLACVVIGALGACIAAWAGWLNADLEPHGKGVADFVEVHRWLGITTAGLAALALVGGLFGATGKARGMTALYRVTLVLAAGAVGVTGHWGGSIVYGKGYLTEMLFPRSAPQAPDIEAILAELEAAETTLTIDFATQIAPIFANNCIKCHGPDKSKGGLRLDAWQYVFDDRDADEQVIIPGDAFSSDLSFRIALAPDDEDAMPPEGKGDPLTPADVALIETWINEGAIWADVPIIAPAIEVAESDEPSEKAAADPMLVFDEAAQARQAEVLIALRDRGVVAQQLILNEPWAEVRFDLRREGVTNADFALLEQLAPTLISLNLAGTSITDQELVLLSRLGVLQRLHLERTAITDEGITHLTSLSQLRYLNLHHTAITDQGLITLASLPALEHLYLWETGVTPQAAALLGALKPTMLVEIGKAPTPADFDTQPEEHESEN